MRIQSTTFSNRLEEFEKDPQLPNLGLINLSRKYGYAYLVPMTDSFYSNPAFAIPRIDSSKCETVLANIDNPVFSRLNPTWMAPVVDVLRTMNIRGAFYDIGAFVGSVSIHYANRAGAILNYVAFEPNPINRRILELNLDLNDALSAVRVESMACSISEGIQTFSVWPNSAISGRLVQTPKAGTLTFPVQTISVESYLSVNPVEEAMPLILKVDTEGHEWDVLKGVRKAWWQVMCCVVEYWPSRDLSYESYLLENFHVLQVRSTMFSDPIPYKSFTSALALKEYGDESIRTSHNVDILLVPRFKCHSAGALLLANLTH